MNQYESVRYYNRITCFLFNILPGYFHPCLYRFLLRYIPPARLVEKMEDYVEMDQKAWTRFALALDYGMNKDRYNRLLKAITYSPNGTFDQDAFDKLQSRDRKFLRPFINKNKAEIMNILQGR